jgi:hypothetical protein
MKVRVVSDGTIYGTNIFDVASGAEVQGIVGVRIWHEAGEIPKADITVLAAEVDVIADATFLAHEETALGRDGTPSGLVPVLRLVDRGGDPE